MYDCTQIRVNYKRPINTTDDEFAEEGQLGGGGGVEEDENALIKPRYERALRDYDYVEDFEVFTDDDDDEDNDDAEDDKQLPKPFPTGIFINK